MTASLLPTFLSVKITKVGTLVRLLRLLHPAGHRAVVDPELLGRLLEGVVHGKLPHFLLELVEALLASLLVPGDDSEMVFGAVSLSLVCLLVWRLVILAGVITFSWSLWSCLVPAPANLLDNISSPLILLQLRDTVTTVTTVTTLSQGSVSHSVAGLLGILCLRLR